MRHASYLMLKHKKLPHTSCLMDFRGCPGAGPGSRGKCSRRQALAQEENAQGVHSSLPHTSCLMDLPGCPGNGPGSRGKCSRRPCQKLLMASMLSISLPHTSCPAPHVQHLMYSTTCLRMPSRVPFATHFVVRILFKLSRNVQDPMQ